MTQSVVVVIVLYRTEADHCVSLKSFLHAASRLERDDLAFEVVLYNNTPECRSQGSLPSGVTYVEDASNSGLATAYNLALRMAIDKGYTWLMTLDQDTELPPDSLSELCTATSALSDRPDVAAIVPQIRAGGRIVSPNFFRAGALPTWYRPGYTGIPEQGTFAFNSGSLLRVAALQQVGGFSPWFWLDNSDSYIYRQLFKMGKRVYVAGNIELKHDFSMMEMGSKVSPARYKTILLSESAFWDTEMNRLAGWERSARLAARTVKHLVRRDSAELRRLTRWGLLRRLFHTRRYRIREWRGITAEKIAGFPAAEPLCIRPKISVCMAAYNGEDYIFEQLQTIASQLGRDDEIVIIDDVSKDRTVSVVEEFRGALSHDVDSPAILLSRHERNQGVVCTFEDALRAATGDILFLADDDDLWAPDKVAKVLQAFEDPEVQLVSTGVQTIDKHGNPTEAPELMRSRGFSTHFFANLTHNQFQGSALALRSSMLRQILPFPKGRVYVHDAWIGLRTIASGSKFVHLDEPLLLYRYHGKNFTRGFSRWKQAKKRLQLIFDLFQRRLFGF